MIEFKAGTPAAPGSLEFGDEFQEAINSRDFERIAEMVKNFGATLLLNVEPPTPARAVEVAYPLVESHGLNTRKHFMMARLEGALDEDLKQRQRLTHV